MIKNKLFGYVMTGALSLGVIGGAAHAFAATESNTDATPAVEQAVNVKASLDETTKEKVQAIMDDLKSNLATIGVELPAKGGHGPRGDFLTDLDDATKEKAQAILDQEKDGSITREEAQTQLAALGVEFPSKGNHGSRGDFLADLDDATKEKAQAILDQEKDGTITREEAQAQLATLDVELPSKGNHRDFLAGLDANTKEVAQDLIDDAEAQLAELGVDHLPLKGFKGSKIE
ncbi:hypothetical protein [Lysinibacillus sp. BW-2-10]|uniref:hypothetical protein n=1 Tax=Lysinibacillus sp. BW-2-10 TaxID=2590030 RepID=UPI00117E4E98|nr:hypothetical protein [Lysinibacillus sp. BW-2-10]TSI07387.1 hypothetical protein FJQ64_08785 [Lysinibacillus sp. BW-2-10]